MVGERFIACLRAYDWLGEWIYFWEYGPFYRFTRVRMVRRTSHALDYHAGRPHGRDVTCLPDFLQASRGGVSTTLHHG